MKKKLITWIGSLSAIATIIGVALQSVDFFKVQNTETVKTESEFKNKLQSNDIKVESNGIINQGVIGNISNIQSQQTVSNVNNNYNNNRNLNYTNIQNKITDNNVKNIENKNTQINQKNIKNDTKDNKDLIKEKIYEKQEKIIGELEEFKENYSYWDDKKIEDAYEKLKQNIKMNFNVTEELERLDKQRYGMRVFPKPTAKEMIDRIRKTHWDSLSEAMKKEQKEELEK
ncbi:hypothetical protein HMPREF1984_00594 [Leptotrichia sp. oral taxon 215 str. W9775]|jgi:transcription initiation factor TFIID subunit 1|uniref:hypothetical protein n=1 Tax=Leptotrichia sp. oral taxon 215 TaxID=712359 RepID=UPI0003AE74F4|nr:hypothetical protein [Leptotrichia sp. oral taxon 215]ERK68385.1 hypothetical protein HMPREF1984_00594 [Leptotrichia sp. oral taxon 215 str. W9775]